MRAYSDVLTSPGFLARAIGRLKPFHARDRIAEWNALADAGAHDVLAMSLMERHYDPAYARAQRGGGPTIREISLAALADADIALDTSSTALAAGAIAASFLFFFSLGYGARLLRPLFQKPVTWKVLEFIIGVTMWGIAVQLLRGA